MRKSGSNELLLLMDIIKKFKIESELGSNIDVQTFLKPNIYIIWEKYGHRFLFQPIAALDVYLVLDILNKAGINSIKIISKPPGKLSVWDIHKIIDSGKTKRDGFDILYDFNAKQFSEDSYKVITYKFFKDIKDAKEINKIILDYQKNLMKEMGIYCYNFSKPIISMVKPNINDYVISILDYPYIKTRHKFTTYSLIVFVLIELWHCLKDKESKDDFCKSIEDFMSQQKEDDLGDAIRGMINSLEDISFRKSYIESSLEKVEKAIKAKGADTTEELDMFNLALKIFEFENHNGFDFIEEIKRITKNLSAISDYLHNLDNFLRYRVINNSKYIEVISSLFIPSFLKIYGKWRYGFLIDPCIEKKNILGREISNIDNDILHKAQYGIVYYGGKFRLLKKNNIDVPIEIEKLPSKDYDEPENTEITSGLGDNDNFITEAEHENSQSKQKGKHMEFTDFASDIREFINIALRFKQYFRDNIDPEIFAFRKHNTIFVELNNCDNSEELIHHWKNIKQNIANLIISRKPEKDEEELQKVIKNIYSYKMNQYRICQKFIY
ncbi:MAG: hypothetical protein ABWJ98_05095 [Hydrogenothermaceae bacterium]